MLFGLSRFLDDQPHQKDEGALVLLLEDSRGLLNNLSQGITRHSNMSMDVVGAGHSFNWLDDDTSVSHLDDDRFKSLVMATCCQRRSGVLDERLAQRSEDLVEPTAQCPQ